MNNFLFKNILYKNKDMKVIRPAVSGATPQPIAILPKTLKLIDDGSLATPTPITAPIKACVVERGTNGNEGKLFLIKMPQEFEM